MGSIQNRVIVPLFFPESHMFQWNTANLKYFGRVFQVECFVPTSEQITFSTWWILLSTKSHAFCHFFYFWITTLWKWQRTCPYKFILTAKVPWEALASSVLLVPCFIHSSEQPKDLKCLLQCNPECTFGILELCIKWWIRGISFIIIV